MNLMLAIGLLAQEQPRDTGPEFGKASPLGLLILVLLLIGTFLLVRSMNRQLRKLPESFDDETTQVDDEATASDADSATGDDAGTDTATDGPKREPGG